MKRLCVSTISCMLVSIVLSAVLVLGCSEKKAKQGGSGPKGEKLEVVSLKELPAMGEPIPRLLDEGRVEVKPPAKWHIAPQSTKYIVRFQGYEKEAYPSIIVTAEDYQQREKIFNVAQDNVEEFAELTGAACKAAGRKLIRPVKPIKIGPLLAVTYGSKGQAKGKFKAITLERLFVETVVTGRKYNVELRAREGNAKKYRKYLLAATAGLKFVKAQTAEPPGEEPAEPGPKEPAEKPAAKPAEKPAAKPAEKPAAESSAEQLKGLVAAGTKTFSQIKFPRDKDAIEWTVGGRPVSFTGKRNSSSGSVADGDEPLFEIGSVKTATATIEGQQIRVAVQRVTFKTPMSDRAREVAKTLGICPEGTAFLYQDSEPKFLAYKSKGEWVFFDCGPDAGPPEPKKGSLK